MPCEGCHVQFTVFRRKRSCSDCKRFYCNNCLAASKRGTRVVLCERCAVFAKRPLLKADLIHLKPKDLIFYLQSKHIPTTGCVEKDELVGLVLNHVQQLDAGAGAGNANTTPHACSSPHSETDAPHSFDNIKQTCQNFFSNLSDNISDSFASFDGKPSAKPRPHYGHATQTSPTTHNGPTHIINQPRAGTREIPTYASYQHAPSSPSQSPPSTSSGSGATSIHRARVTPVGLQGSTVDRSASASPASHTASPGYSSSSPTTSPPTSGAEISQTPILIGSNDVHKNDDDEDDEEEGCACSDDDDEIVASFNEQRAKELTASAGTVGPSTTSTSNGKTQTPCSKTTANDEDDESSQSSFEELGAIGGISDDSKTTTTDTNSSNLEQWQILDTQQRAAAERIEEPPKPTEAEAVMTTPTTDADLQVAIVQLGTQPMLTQSTVQPRPKKVLRRRSDGYLNRRRARCDDDSPTSPTMLASSGFPMLREQAEAEATAEEPSAEQMPRLGNCQRCGKNKTSIRRQVDSMRRHLESAQMSEDDIKQELHEFLSYMEARTKSMDCSDTDTAVSPTSVLYGASRTPEQFDDENIGIHVYASMAQSSNESRFINLDDFETLEELESLSVKQLKEILMLNRVDYKGCCEKHELFDRVQRLWKNLKSAPGVDRLQTDELCKICMDAPIECVILECGHMATCTNCGKVLSECPICRQYIVRVVRFFRA